MSRIYNTALRGVSQGDGMLLFAHRSRQLCVSEGSHDPPCSEISLRLGFDCRFLSPFVLELSPPRFVFNISSFSDFVPSVILQLVVLQIDTDSQYAKQDSKETNS